MIAISHACRCAASAFWDGMSLCMQGIGPYGRVGGAEMDASLRGKSYLGRHDTSRVLDGVAARLGLGGRLPAVALPIRRLGAVTTLSGGGIGGSGGGCSIGHGCVPPAGCRIRCCCRRWLGLVRVHSGRAICTQWPHGVSQIIVVDANI